MKVAELYQLLKQLPSDAQVLVETSAGVNESVLRTVTTHNGEPALTPVSSLILVPQSRGAA